MSSDDPLEVDPIRVLIDLARLQRAEVPDASAELRAAVEGLAVDDRKAGRRVRRPVVIGLATLVALGGATAAVAALIGRQPDRPDQAPACRDAPSLSANMYALEPGAEALERCSALWIDGTISSPDYPPGSLPPPLVACIGPGGVIEVFPGSADVCAELDLDPASSNLDADADAIVRLTNRIADELNGGPCVDGSTAIALVQTLLDDLGLKDWTIDANALPSDATCVKGAPDPATNTVHLVVL